MGGKQSRHQNYQCPHNASQSYGAPSIASSSPYTSYSQRHLNYNGMSSPYPSHSQRHVNYSGINSPYPSYSQRHVNYSGSSSVQSRYTRIGDEYSSLDQVTAALAQAGLESSNLIVGIDFTKSNEWTGARSFNHRSLHHLGNSPNPYEQAISIIGRTLSAFDEDNLIPCYGFGDASTHDQEVFSFYPDERSCDGFEEVLGRYRELVPHIRLAGPTSFAPIIETAVRIVDNSGGQYHVLLIIADGQVTRSVDTSLGQLSPQEKNTINAIVKASEYPLSIVLVGVGDGPWEMMRQFDDNIPSRVFDNFRFVNFTEIMSKHTSASKKETDFALEALMEIPQQYKATIDHQMLGCRRGNTGRIAIPPPIRNYSSVNFFEPCSLPTSFEQSNRFQYTPPHQPAENSSPNKNCPVCFWTEKDLAFGCGHQTCYDCGREMTRCPICRTQITTRIRLYD